MSSRITAAIWVGWAAAGVQLREIRASQLAFLVGAVQPAVYVVITLWARQRMAPTEVTRLLLGVALTALWGATIWTAGGILRREQSQGTLVANFTGVHPSYVVLLGKCVGAIAPVAFVIMVTTAATAALLGVRVPWERPWLMLLGVVLAIASGTALGMLLSCLFILTRSGSAWSGLLMFPVFILGGLLIPPALVHGSLRWIAALISLHWIHEWEVRAATGTADLPALAAATLLTVGYFGVAIVMFGRVLDRARRKGTLELV